MSDLATQPLSGAQDVVTVIQLTDAHAVGDGRLLSRRSDVNAALSRAGARLRQLAPRLQGLAAVVVTGDLAEDGADADYAAFKRLLGPTPAPLHVLPGNHDTRSGLRRAFGLNDGGDPETPMDQAATLGPVRIILLDTVVPGAPQGRLSNAQLSDLDGALDADGDTPTLIFAHHPAFDTDVTFMDGIKLENGDALLEAVAGRSQVKLLACGHAHRAVQTVRGGVSCVIAPATAHAIALDHRPGAAPGFEMGSAGFAVHVWRRCAKTPCGVLTTSFVSIDAEGPFGFTDGALQEE